MPTKADLERLLVSAERRLEAAEKDRQEFEERVASVAKKYAIEHGWCEVVDNALVEMGVAFPKVTYKIELKVTLEAVLADGARVAQCGGDLSRFVRSSVNVDQNGFLDADWEDEVFFDVEVLTVKEADVV